MKTSLLLLCTVIFFILANPTLGHSQGKARLYRVIITDLYNNRIEGILYRITDSTLTYVPNTSRAIRSLRDGEPNLYTIKADDIHQMTIRRKGQVLRSMLIGTGVGIALSVALSTLTKPREVGNGRDFKLGAASLNVMRWAIITIAPVGGAEMGAIAGLINRKKIVFSNGNYSFKANRPYIEPFSYEYQAMH